MLHGRPVRPHTAVAKPLKVDQSSIAHIPGVVKVVQEGSFVGVVAETEWAAIQAAKALKVTWSQPQTQMPANREAVDTYLTDTKPVRELTAAKAHPSCDKKNHISDLAKARKILPRVWKF